MSLWSQFHAEIFLRYACVTLGLSFVSGEAICRAAKTLLLMCFDALWSWALTLNVRFLPLQWINQRKCERSTAVVKLRMRSEEFRTRNVPWKYFLFISKSLIPSTIVSPTWVFRVLKRSTKTKTHDGDNDFVQLQKASWSSRTAANRDTARVHRRTCAVLDTEGCFRSHL